MDVTLTIPNMSEDDLGTTSISPVQASPTAAPDEMMTTSFTHLLIYVCFGLLICFGNGVTFLAVWKSPRLNSKADFYIAWLALADFVVGITLVTTALTGIEEIGKVFRENRYACLSYLSTIVVSLTASLLTVVCLSIDRCICIVKPLKYIGRQKKRTHFIVIAMVWIVSIAYAAIPYMNEGWFVAGAVCIATIQHPKWYLIYSHPLMGTTCFAAVIVCYIIIAKTYHKQVKKWTTPSSPKSADLDTCTEFDNKSDLKDNSSSSDNSNEGTPRQDKATPECQVPKKSADDDVRGDRICSSLAEVPGKVTISVVGEDPDVEFRGRRLRREHRLQAKEVLRLKRIRFPGSTVTSVTANAFVNQTKQNIRLAKMTFIILVVFFLCWFPGNIILIVSAFIPIESSIQMLFLVLTFLNSGLNVVIYVIMNIRYREAVLSVICCFSCHRWYKMGMGGNK